MFRAVFLDMDGLLTDTETLAGRAVRFAAEQTGAHLSDACILRTLGMNQQSSDRIFLEEDPRFQPGPFWQAFSRYQYDYMEEHGTPLKPGAVRMVSLLRKRAIPYALVSSSNRDTVEHNMDCSPMKGWFPCMITAQDGLPGKPSPAMYLRAAELLSVPAESGLVLEDSPNGLRAGRAAGMTTWMVPDLVPWSEALAPYCDRVFCSLEEAADCLEALQ